MGIEVERTTPEPAGYEQIAEALRNQIRNGTILAGSLMPTERELQGRFGASRTTVRRALAVLASDGWAEVLPNRGAIARLGPTPRLSDNVAFIDHADSVNSHLFFAISQALRVHGLNLVHLDSKPLGVEGALEHALEARFAAAFIWSKTGTPDLPRVTEVIQRLPVIALDHDLVPGRVDLVCWDHFGGGVLAVRHLVSQGRRNIAVTGMMDMLASHHAAFSGFLTSHFPLGLAPQARNFCFCHTSDMPGADTLTLDRRLRDDDRPDAVLILQDLFVPDVFDSIDRAGLSVPDDVAVVSFGGGAQIELDGIPLTVVEAGRQAMAGAAVERLMARLANPGLPITTTTLPIHLVVGGTCGEPRTDWQPNCPDEDALGQRVRSLSALRMRPVQLRSRFSPAPKDFVTHPSMTKESYE